MGEEFESIVVEDEVVQPQEEEVVEDNVDDVTDGEGEPESDVPEAQPQQEQDIKFDATQQKKIDKIVETRLARAEKQFIKKLSESAGVELKHSGEASEIKDAVNLWGFMKLNPELSTVVQKAIDDFVSKGNYNKPQQSNSRESELALKEAVLDMKLGDKTFAKYEKQIMEWADENGYNPFDKKSLNLVYTAWKGQNLKSELAKQQLAEQRKSQQKQTVTKKAVLEQSKGRQSKQQLDYRKMADRDILASEGLSLFTED